MMIIIIIIIIIIVIVIIIITITIIIIIIIMQRKQYCQSRFHLFVAILEEKYFEVEYDSLNFFQGTCRLKWNNNMRTMKLSTCFSA